MQLFSIRPLRIINHPDGNILHFLKANDPDFSKFGEVYFSIIKKGSTKGWKKHTRMTCNIVVISGFVEFILHDEKTFKRFLIGRNDQSNFQHALLTIYPGTWFSFHGLEDSIISNVADIVHDPEESVNVPLSDFSPQFPR